MHMQDQDLIALADMVEEYQIEDIVEALEQLAIARASDLVDQGDSERAKELSRVAWHLHLLRNNSDIG
jgi:23S rRNA C2498 (ribose-2'-O)-methylase RlmM